MALSIKNPDADRLARALAATTGESLTDAVVIALEERLERERTRRAGALAHRLKRLAAEVQDLPVLDQRKPDDIVGFDEHGLPE